MSITFRMRHFFFIVLISCVVQPLFAGEEYSVFVAEAIEDIDSSNYETISQKGLAQRVLVQLRDVTASAARSLYIYTVNDDTLSTAEASDITITPMLKKASLVYYSTSGTNVISLHIEWLVSGAYGNHIFQFSAIGADERVDIAVTKALSYYEEEIGYKMISDITLPSILMISGTFNGYVTMRYAESDTLCMGDKLIVQDPETNTELALLTVVRTKKIMDKSSVGGSAELLVNYAAVPLHAGVGLQKLADAHQGRFSLQELQTLSSSGLSLRYRIGRDDRTLHYTFGLDVSYCWGSPPLGQAVFLDTMGTSILLTQGFIARVEPGRRYSATRSFSSSRIWFETGADLGIGYYIDPIDDSTGWIYTGSYHAGVGWYVDRDHEFGLRAGYTIGYPLGSDGSYQRSALFVSPYVTFRL